MRHIIGFGNALHGDDGFGPEVCRRLAALPGATGLRIFDAATRGLDALPLFAGCSEAVVIDAAAPGAEPGKITEWSPAGLLEEAHEDGLHGGGLRYLLRALQSQDAALPRIRIVTAEAQSITRFQPGLSDPMRAAVDETVRHLKLWLDTVETQP